MGAIDKPAKERVLLVRFDSSDASTPQTRFVYISTNYALNFASWELPIDNGPGGTAIPCPSMSVEIPENSGVFDDKIARIVMPLMTAEGVKDPFVDDASSGEAHAPITIRIYLGVLDVGTLAPGYNPSIGPSADWYCLFRGKVQRVVRNYQGRANQVSFEAGWTVKSQLRVPLGLVAQPQCIWTLGGPGCYDPTRGGVDINAAKTTGQVNLIRSKEIEVISMPALPAPGGVTQYKYYHRGYVELNGLAIGTRDFISIGTNSGRFLLLRDVPQSWLGKTITLVPGCDKSIETCRARWNNEANFGGFGFAIPAYHPVIEDAAGAP